jgi:hypothetical protein
MEGHPVNGLNFLFFGMHFISQLLLYTAIVSFLFMGLGLYKPWVMLWWEDVQNRKKVIRLYGTISVLSFVFYMILTQLL